jgi:dolichyl-phosphate-mannose-protein mannosyltransferase
MNTASIDNLVDRQPQSTWDKRLIMGGLVIFAIALSLRLWDLGRFDYPVFDEIYFPKFAENYLSGEAFRDGHPPLGKYMIMLGILAFGHNEIGYRIASAITGATIPILVMGVMYYLSGRWFLALIAGALTLADGLLLVESRYGLINVFLLAFGLAAQVLLLAGLRQQGRQRTLLLCGSGLMLGASAAVKLNGLGFLLMFALVGVMVWAIALLWPKYLTKLGILAEVTTLRWWQYALCFIFLPAIFYVLQWIPHLMLNPVPSITPPESSWGLIPYYWRSIVAMQLDLWDYNTSPSIIGINIHPYCSSWISWPVSGRPVGYYYHYEEATKIVQDVHAIGNPVLWWFSTLAVISLSLQGLRQFRAIHAYVLIGYAANYLPWLLVSRCLFIYHYMSAALFSFMALTIALDQLLPKNVESWAGLKINLRSQWWRYTIFASIMLAVFSSQIFFIPIWLGTDLSFTAFYQRMWSQYVPLGRFNWI